MVDTNVLVAATFEDLTGHTAARALMEHLLASDIPWCLAWATVYEYLRVVTHPRVFARPLRWRDAMRQVSQLLSHRRLEILTETDRHAEVLEAVVEGAGGASGNFVHDCHIAALMVEHDVRRIVTADTHFRRFRDLVVLAPEEAAVPK
jgi:hypothetical protein